MSDDDWFDEIDLDPDGAWLRMGTRNLGDRPWLVADGRRVDELALKARLLAERHDEVFAVADDAGPASNATLALVEAALAGMGFDPDVVATEADPTRALHPLDRAGRMVQEDLCLLRPVDGQWILAGASLCFPSRWRLADKFERPLPVVHGPVEGYREALSDRVDRLLDRLGSAIVWRRNWFLHPDPALFQPERPVGGDPVIPAERCGEDVFVRSERQTLRRLEPTDWVLFTIRVQQAPLARFTADPAVLARLRRFVEEAAPDLAAHKGVSAAQRNELRRWLPSS